MHLPSLVHLCVTALLLNLASAASKTYYNQVTNTYFTENEIRDKIALYAIGIDTRNFALMDEIFWDDVQAVYFGNNTFSSLTSLKTYLAGAINVTAATQHAISTILINSAPKSQILTTSYLTANYLGQGPDAGKLAQVFATYHDVWESKANDNWFIKQRNCSFVAQGLIGDPKLVLP